MKVAVHQPNFMPYLGFFDKMAKVDIWVNYDDAKFVPRDFHHRNRIGTPDGPFWLTVPINKPPHFSPEPIRRISIKKAKIKSLEWQDYFIEQIRNSYKKAPFFNTYFPKLKELLETPEERLLDLNIKIINFLRECFGIKNKITFSSSLAEKNNIESRSTQKIIDLCKIVGADTYISGEGGRNYLDEELTKKAGINLEYQTFNHPIYRQIKNRPFQKNLSAIDYLFNCGGTFPNGN